MINKPKIEKRIKCAKLYSVVAAEAKAIKQVKIATHDPIINNKLEIEKRIKSAKLIQLLLLKLMQSN